jgi:ech hydrogenase subunit A
LLFLSVGTIEHKIASRDIEDMTGLIALYPGLGFVMLVGILGMFLAPFGMLISKWAALQAFIDVKPPILALLLAFGSAPTLFFWTKWMGKIVSIPQDIHKARNGVSGNEWTALGLLAALTMAACGLFPLIASTFITPYLIDNFSQRVNLESGNLIIMSIMLAFMIIVPLGFALYPKKWPLTPTYLSGANIGGSLKYRGAMGREREVGIRSYYLSGFLSEAGLTNVSVIATLVLIVAMFVTILLPQV